MNITAENDIPHVGQRVSFGHMLVDGTRTGTITEVRGISGNRFECRVAVDFLPADNPEKNPPGKVVGSCLWFASEAALDNGIPASHWQFCCPLESEPLPFGERSY